MCFGFFTSVIYDAVKSCPGSASKDSLIYWTSSEQLLKETSIPIKWLPEQRPVHMRVCFCLRVIPLANSWRHFSFIRGGCEMGICCTCIVTAGWRRNIRSRWGVCTRVPGKWSKTTVQWQDCRWGKQCHLGQSEPGFTCSFHDSATDGRDSKWIARSVHVALPALTKS